MLSKQEINYLKSQIESNTRINKSELRSRIRTKTKASLAGLEIISESKELDSDYLRELFPAKQIMKIVGRFCRTEEDDSIESETNKLEITLTMLNLALSFYQNRFKEIKFLKSKMNELSEIIYEINKIAKEKRDKIHNLELYKKRKRWKLPPKLESKKEYQAICIICWANAASKNKDEATKNIKHQKNCHYDKTDLERCILYHYPENS